MQYVVKRDQAVLVNEHGISAFTEYAMPSKNLALGLSEINGRYPENGVDVDTKIEQLWYVMEGSGTLTIAGEEYSFAAGDMVYIPPNQPYVIEGTMKLVVASSPPWTADQHQHIDDVKSAA